MAPRKAKKSVLLKCDSKTAALDTSIESEVLFYVDVQLLEHSVRERSSKRDMAQAEIGRENFEMACANDGSKSTRVVRGSSQISVRLQRAGKIPSELATSTRLDDGANIRGASAEDYNPTSMFLWCLISNCALRRAYVTFFVPRFTHLLHPIHKCHCIWTIEKKVASTVDSWETSIRNSNLLRGFISWNGCSNLLLKR